jgi:hypothetical protein
MLNVLGGFRYVLLLNSTTGLTSRPSLITMKQKLVQSADHLHTATAVEPGDYDNLVYIDSVVLAKCWLEYPLPASQPNTYPPA